VWGFDDLSFYMKVETETPYCIWLQELHLWWRKFGFGCRKICQDQCDYV